MYSEKLKADLEKYTVYIYNIYMEGFRMKTYLLIICAWRGTVNALHMYDSIMWYLVSLNLWSK